MRASLPGAGCWSTVSTSARDSSSWPGATRPKAPRSSGSTLATLPFEQEFDAAICLCQGAFGLMVDERDDDAVVAGIATALVPGGVLALSAFNAYFAVKYHIDATFDAATGVAHERTEVRNEAGEAIETDLWTRCYTPSRAALRSSAATASPSTGSAASNPARTGRRPRPWSHPSSWSSHTGSDSAGDRRVHARRVTREVTQGLLAVVARSR